MEKKCPKAPELDFSEATLSLLLTKALLNGTLDEGKSKTNRR